MESTRLYYGRCSTVDELQSRARPFRMNELCYLSGFGNEFESEAIAGALPQGQFSPQRAPYGLYAEKFSNTAFTVPRADNRRTWFYRIRPSVTHGAFSAFDAGRLRTAPLDEGAPPPNPLRWDPPSFDAGRRDFIDGLTTVCANGDAHAQFGIGVHLYDANADMGDRYFMDSDGELLLVPQRGRLRIATECGVIEVEPGEIALIPRGMKFKVDLPDAQARGYVCENYGAHLRLPERGLVGSDGYANTRDFLTPVAHYDDRDIGGELIGKFQGGLYRAALAHAPLDVVAWVGNAVPCKYDLARFNALNTVSFDHPDPSIFTVLTSPSSAAGVANLDFVIFPPRWLVAEHTFRPPWYHRNVMSEFMGLVHGRYDAKKAGFEPGGMSLHNALVAHGPEAQVFAQASSAALEPVKLDHTLAFMFETRYVLHATAWAMQSPALQRDYHACWSGLDRRFEPPG
jgi:homogentisate 1,2-dioxygenase